MLEDLKKLCSINGTSGREEAVRAYIISKIEGKCEFKVDAMGNIIGSKKGAESPKNKVMLAAHMDEVGFVVTEICSDGLIKVAPVGGIDSKVVCGRKLVFPDKISCFGVVGTKPVHLCSSDEMKTVPSISDLSVDIGASSKEDAEKFVEIGDSAYFETKSFELGENKFCSKAIDDRIGCRIIIDMINSEAKYDFRFAFLVREEVGLRGSPAATFRLCPDYAIVLEATTASDVAGVSGSKKVCVLGRGAVVSFADRSTVYDRDLFKKAFALAKQNEIPIQTKTVIAGGNDAGSIHKANGGVKTVTISLPCRYIHSPNSVADVNDMISCEKLAKVLLEDFANA